MVTMSPSPPVSGWIDSCTGCACSSDLILCFAMLTSLSSVDSCILEVAVPPHSTRFNTEKYGYTSMPSRLVLRSPASSVRFNNDQHRDKIAKPAKGPKQPLGEDIQKSRCFGITCLHGCVDQGNK